MILTLALPSADYGYVLQRVRFCPERERLSLATERAPFPNRASPESNGVKPETRVRAAEKHTAVIELQK